MTQLFKVNQPNISLSVPVNGFLSLYDTFYRRSGIGMSLQLKGET